VLEAQTAAMSPVNPLPFTAAEERGRLVYAREGCAYCHTQQIRYLEADIRRFGAPTLAWETRFDYPHMMGTRRIGPDLSRSANTRTEDWHYVHLFAPRSVVPDSIMPPYAALFDGSPDRPSQAARDLVAYLDALGRARELAWPEGDQDARAGANGDRWALMSLDAPELNAHPGRSRPRGNVPAIAATATADGAAAWQANCSGCHGGEGRGDGPAARWLEPAPTNLAQREYTPERLQDVLWNGIHGTAMPAWRDLPAGTRAALVETVGGFSAVASQPASPPDLVSEGSVVYTTHCAECHGDTGDGNGFAAEELPIMPTDFRGERPGLDESIRILREGVKGTSMAPWTDRLTDDEIVAVAHYVRQFFDGPAAGSAR
jgi:mono/diheme cytochrome c family protein